MFTSEVMELARMRRHYVLALRQLPVSIDSGGSNGEDKSSAIKYTDLPGYIDFCINSV